MKGRPILGAVGGLFLGIFGALELVIFKVVESDSIVILLLPIVMLVLGLALGIMQPIGGRAASAADATD